MHEHLDVPYHQQDTDVYCGAACAQMVLRAGGQPLLAQVDLYNDNHGHSLEAIAWATPPDGLCWTLNNRQSQKHFTLDSTDTEDPISRTICWAIHNYQCAPIALVFGGNHWAVVRGYTASAAPTASYDTSYTISSFDLNNPWPPVPAPPGPPPHTDGDVCGSGGTHGVADINVSYGTWQTDYLTPNMYGTQWLGKFVAVCDPDPTDPPGTPAPPPPLPSPPLPTDGQPLIDPERVKEQLLGKLREAGLLSRPDWSKVFEGARAGEPILAQRLDRLDSYYWIVPAVDAQGTMRAVVGIDAHSGNYQQAMALPDPNSPFFGFAEAQKATDRVQSRRLDLPAGAGRLIVRPEGLSVHPALVWRPCLESLSPFYPFRMMLLGAQRLYVRVYDGAVFTKLSYDRGGL